MPYPFSSGDELLRLCESQQMSIAALMLENEKTWRSAEEIHTGLLRIWAAMHGCMQRGYLQEGDLPGGLRVKRRAPALHGGIALLIA